LIDPDVVESGRCASSGEPRTAAPFGVSARGVCGAPAARSTPVRPDGWTFGPSFAAAVVDAPLFATDASNVSAMRVTPVMMSRVFPFACPLAGMPTRTRDRRRPGAHRRVGCADSEGRKHARVHRHAQAAARLGSLQDSSEATPADRAARVAREPAELQLVARQPPSHSLVRPQSWHATAQTANHKLHDKNGFSPLQNYLRVDSDKVDTRFRKTSCSSNSLERDDGSKKSHQALAER
jgi:hypothetical protein